LAQPTQRREAREQRVGAVQSSSPLQARAQVRLSASHEKPGAQRSLADEVAIDVATILGDVGVTLERRGDLLDEGFLRELHRRMFGEVWRWAGKYRETPRNIGVDANRIRTDIAQAIDDARFWVANGTYEPDEIAVRYSHRLVAIHPFPNGNGRHSRMMADALLRSLGQAVFTWGSGGSLVAANEVRARYWAALRAADQGDYSLLLAFVRS
jgi:Fic-DOC domain mobile mystery protein B